MTPSNQQPSPVLQVKDLSMAFGGLVAFENVSFDILEGQIVALIGPNGAGKTTMINCITGVYKPVTGDVMFHGESMVNRRLHQICRHGIGRTFQIPRPFMNMSVLENCRACALNDDLDYK